jgi:hypothetical protein
LFDAFSSREPVSTSLENALKIKILQLRSVVRARLRLVHQPSLAWPDSLWD